MKRRIMAVVLMLVVMCTLTACSWQSEDAVIESASSPFVRISNDIVYDNPLLSECVADEDEVEVFMYDKHTKIIFYLFSSYNYGLIEDDHTYTYFGEFIDKNGYKCRYDPSTKTVTEIIVN